MADDFYLQAGSQRLAQIEAERAAALADLAAYKVNGDRESAAQSIQQIANLDVELGNLNNLYQRYQGIANSGAAAGAIAGGTSRAANSPHGLERCRRDDAAIQIREKH